MQNGTRTASWKLRVVIIGGGIGGLASAYALAKAGHHVRVLEKSENCGFKDSAGIRIPPNLARILFQWGLGPKLIQKAIKCDRLAFRQLATGEFVGSLEYKEEVMKVLGADYWLMHYSDLICMLHDLAVEQGVIVKCGKHVVAVNPPSASHLSRSTAASPIEPSANGRNSPRLKFTELRAKHTKTGPTVVLSTGEVIDDIDLLIGADGYTSLVRAIIERDSEDLYDSDESDQDFSDDGKLRLRDGIPSNSVVYTLAVDTSDLVEHANNRGDQILQDNEKTDKDRLWEYVKRPEWSAYMGPYISVLTHPIRDFNEFSIQLYLPEVPNSGAQETWNQVVDADEVLNNRLEGFCDTLKTLISRKRTALEVKYIKRHNIDEWVHPSGRLVLLGEAAHPQIPGSTHSGSLAVEDAAVLGSLLSRLRNISQLPQLLGAYQDLRLDRSSAIQLSEAANSASVMLPPGPEQIARDEGMRAANELGHGGWDDKQFRHLWEAIRVLFAYDPDEEVQEWWQQWGRLRERANSIRAVAVTGKDIDERLEDGFTSPTMITTTTTTATMTSSPASAIVRLPAEFWTAQAQY